MTAWHLQQLTTKCEGATGSGNTVAGGGRWSGGGGSAGKGEGIGAGRAAAAGEATSNQGHLQTHCCATPAACSQAAGFS
eukprot:8919420-Alexandrium_andersonii.AAC.1